MSRVIRTAAVVVGAAALILTGAGIAFPALVAAGGPLSAAALGGITAGALSATAMSLTPAARRLARRRTGEGAPDAAE